MRHAEWWKTFKRKHIVDHERNLWPVPEQTPTVADVLPQAVAIRRVIPHPIHRPDGTSEPGWLAFAQNDGARAEVVIAWERTLPPLKGS